MVHAHTGTHKHTHTHTHTLIQPTNKSNNETAGREARTQLLHTPIMQFTHEGKGTDEMKHTGSSPTHKEIQDTEGQQTGKQVQS